MDGITFDSQREARAYGTLKCLRSAGAISHLERQQTFHFEINGVRVASYRADFVFLDREGKRVVADAKGFRTEAYKIKKRLMKALFGIEIMEL